MVSAAIDRASRTHDLDLEQIMVVFVDGRASCPQRSVLADDVLADLELGREAEILHVTVRLGRVQAEQGLFRWRRSYGPEGSA